MGPAENFHIWVVPELGKRLLGLADMAVPIILGMGDMSEDQGCKGQKAPCLFVG